MPSAASGDSVCQPPTRRSAADAYAGAEDENLTLTLPQGWLENHPLGREMVEQECQWQSYVHWPLRLNEQ